MASSLQTAYNLRVLPNLVQSLLLDLSQAVEERLRSAFDLNKISKDVTTKGTFFSIEVTRYNLLIAKKKKEPLSAASPSSAQVYKSRIRTEPTNIMAPQFSSALWARLEAMFQEMADCCIKVCTPSRDM